MKCGERQDSMPVDIIRLNMACAMEGVNPHQIAVLIR
jgi:hypothetical protein